jgi:hypothetical protein
MARPHSRDGCTRELKRGWGAEKGPPKGGTCWKEIISVGSFDKSDRVGITTSISMLGLAAKPSTTVLPTCSMATAISARAFFTDRKSGRKEFVLDESLRHFSPPLEFG